MRLQGRGSGLSASVLRIRAKFLSVFTELRDCTYVLEFYVRPFLRHAVARTETRLHSSLPGVLVWQIRGGLGWGVHPSSAGARSTNLRRGGGAGAGIDGSRRDHSPTRGEERRIRRDRMERRRTQRSLVIDRSRTGARLGGGW